MKNTVFYWYSKMLSEWMNEWTDTLMRPIYTLWERNIFLLLKREDLKFFHLPLIISGKKCTCGNHGIRSYIIFKFSSRQSLSSFLLYKDNKHIGSPSSCYSWYQRMAHTDQRRIVNFWTSWMIRENEFQRKRAEKFTHLGKIL